MPQHITVENYDPEWPLIYTRERDRIACGETCEPGFASPVGHSVSKKEQRRCSFRGGA